MLGFSPTKMRKIWQDALLSMKIYDPMEEEVQEYAQKDFEIYPGLTLNVTGWCELLKGEPRYSLFSEINGRGRRWWNEEEGDWETPESRRERLMKPKETQ